MVLQKNGSTPGHMERSFKMFADCLFGFVYAKSEYTLESASVAGHLDDNF